MIAGCFLLFFAAVGGLPRAPFCSGYVLLDHGLHHEEEGHWWS